MLQYNTHGIFSMVYDITFHKQYQIHDIKLKIHVSEHSILITNIIG